jgi:hypothetical protein
MADELEAATSGVNLLTEGFKLNMDQRGLLIRVGWVALVTGHILWICGFLGVVGLHTPFAEAGAFDDLRQSVSEIQKSGVEGQLRQISMDLFNLERQVSELQAERKSVPDIYWQRINDLRNDKAKLERALATLT